MHRRSATGWLSLVVDILTKSGGFLSSYVCLPAMLVLVISDPFLRYIVGTPLYWSNEVSIFLMVTIVFTGLGITLSKGKHVRVTFIFSILPPKVQNILWVVTCFVSLFYLGTLTYSAILLTISSWEYKVRTLTSEMPHFPWQVLAVLGLIVFFMALVNFTVERIFLASGKGQEKVEEEKALADGGY